MMSALLLLVITWFNSVLSYPVFSYVYQERGCFVLLMLFVVIDEEKEQENGEESENNNDTKSLQPVKSKG